jgi:hypothetical protein
MDGSWYRHRGGMKYSLRRRRWIEIVLRFGRDLALDDRDRAPAERGAFDPDWKP